MTVDLRLGDYREVLQDVTDCRAVITDPPFGARTHRGHDSAGRQVVSATGQKVRRDLDYACWTPADVAEFVAFWAPRCPGWMACMTSHDLITPYMNAYEAAGRYAFAPVGILTYHPRLLGDGPGSGLVYLMCSRPKSREFFGGWSNSPWFGPYYPAADRGAHVGGKPLACMQAIVREYSRVGDLVVDPCSGLATTALACRAEGRRFLGAELSAETYAKAIKRLHGVTADAAQPGEQPRLDL